MGIYDRYILPHLIHLACGTPPVMRQRQKVVPEARGRVLEIGMGSGINLGLYRPVQVEFVWGLEPSEGMRKKAAANVNAAGVEVKWLDLPGEEIPLEDHSVDSIVLTYTLCTIPDYAAALKQMRRVLKPGGQLLFAEHGAAPDEWVRKWQDRVNPGWRAVAGGCHLNRPISLYIEQAGFHIQQLDTGYLPKTPKIAGFNYTGMAS